MVTTQNFILTTPHLYLTIVAMAKCATEAYSAVSHTVTYNVRLPEQRRIARYVSKNQFTIMRQLPFPVVIDVAQGFSTLSYELVNATLNMLLEMNAAGRESYTKVAFFILDRIVYSHAVAHKGSEQGWTQSAAQMREKTGVGVHAIQTVINKMLETGLIYRKWVGNSCAKIGSCYLLDAAYYW